MTDRCICEDYELRGYTYEVWYDGTWGSGGYPNWWLQGGHKPGRVLTEHDFDPELTEKEITAISELAHGRLAG